MRGKVAFNIVTMIQGRITPAYAGKSHEILCIINDDWDHPRLCGEKLFEFGNSGFMMGSPPPMRGKDAGAYPQMFPSGITPAYAGKSGFLYCTTGSRWDHPRLCGEKLTSPHFSQSA